MNKAHVLCQFTHTHALARVLFAFLCACLPPLLVALAPLHHRCCVRALDVLLDAAKNARTDTSALPVGWRQEPSKTRAGRFAYVSPFGDRVAKCPAAPAAPKAASRAVPRAAMHFPSATAYTGAALQGFVRLAELCADVLQGRVGMPDKEQPRVKQVFVESVLTAMR